MARSADHLIQLCHGGPPTRREGIRLAHIGCNTGRSNALRGLAVVDCACSVGQPCAVLNRAAKRGYVALDVGTL